jgi:hypothetical protein
MDADRSTFLKANLNIWNSELFMLNSPYEVAPSREGGQLECRKRPGFHKCAWNRENTIMRECASANRAVGRRHPAKLSCLLAGAL